MYNKSKIINNNKIMKNVFLFNFNPFNFNPFNFNLFNLKLLMSLYIYIFYCDNYFLESSRIALSYSSSCCCFNNLS